MPIIKKPLSNIPPEAKRLTIVIEESGYNQKSFSEAVKLTQASISRMKDGLQPIPLRVIRFICFKLGYSPEWFINGTGNKKKASDSVKLITEVSMLRTEMEIMLQKNILMDARMKSYESELDELKKQLHNRV